MVGCSHLFTDLSMYLCYMCCLNQKGKTNQRPPLVLQNEVFILPDRPEIVKEYAKIKNEGIEKFRGMRSEK